MHQVHLGEGLDVDVVGIVLALGIVAVGGTDGVPGVLEPGLDLVGSRLHGGLGIIRQVFAHVLDGDEVVVGAAAAGAVQTFKGELGIAALGDRVFLIVVVLDQIAVVGNKGVILGRDGIAALVLAVHPDVSRGGIVADAELMGHLQTGAVAHQAVVGDLAEDGPLLGLLGIDAEDVGFPVEGEVIGLLVSGLGPGIVAAALDLRERELLAVDVDHAGAGRLVIGIVVHGGDGAQALIDVDENGGDGRGALPGLDGEGRRGRALGEGVGLGLAGCWHGAGAAGIGGSVHRSLQAVGPGEEDLRRVGVAGQIELIGGASATAAPLSAAGAGFPQIDLRGNTVRFRWCDEHGRRQISLCGARRQGNGRQQGAHHADRKQHAQYSFLHV